MNGNSVALDTNVAVQVLNDAPAAIKFLMRFAEVCLPAPALGELRYGALNSARPAQNLERIDRLLAKCRPLLIDVATADVYARVRFDLKSKGTPIPENDIWIGSLCIQHDLPCATMDAHFARITGIRIEGP
jgi:tRNA(fMet)-specific endonuclease VapC